MYLKPYYDGVKYYSKADLSIGFELKKAEPILNSLETNSHITDVNKIIELFNISELLQTNVKLNEWTDEVQRDYKDKYSLIIELVGRFFGNISDNDFVAHCNQLAGLYYYDFWMLFEKFNVYRKISTQIFHKCLSQHNTFIYSILKNKKVVDAYDKELTVFLLQFDQTAGIISSIFLEENSSKYYLPASFTTKDIEKVLQKYVESGNANTNILRLIIVAPNDKNCPVSDIIKLGAKHELGRIWSENNKKNSLELTFEVGIVEQDEIQKIDYNAFYYKITHSKKWLEETLDYPSILNNFTYALGFFDDCFRCGFISVKSRIGAFEDILILKGRKTYLAGNYFHAYKNITSLQMNLYYEFLKAHNIDLENVFVWFFNEYLLQEFNAEGFRMHYSLSDTPIENCRNIASEMDGLLKQFRMYARYGKIDRELFELSSEHLVIDLLPSFIPNKYAYSTKTLDNEIKSFFSDQTSLSFTKKTKTEYPTLFELLINENIKITDFEEYNIHQIKWLIERGSLILGNDGAIYFNDARVAILKDLYENGVCCTSYWGKNRSVLFEMEKAGDLRFGSTLFSEPEIDYMNYILNKSKFSDGLDLRNKYAHSSYSYDENVQKGDYIELLKIMILVVTKINEEFDLRERLRAEAK